MLRLDSIIIPALYGTQKFFRYSKEPTTGFCPGSCGFCSGSCEFCPWLHSHNISVSLSWLFSKLSTLISQNSSPQREPDIPKWFLFPVLVNKNHVSLFGISERCPWNNFNTYYGVIKRNVNNNKAILLRSSH